MIVEYVRYRIPEDRAQAFEEAYRTAQAALQQSPHCLGFELSRASAEPERYVLRILWTSAEGHMTGFRKSASFGPFLQAVRPFIDDLEEMQHYEVTDVRSETSIYDAVGGGETFFRLAKRMHEKMCSDELLGPRFAHAAESHVPHLGMWLCEVFGGPKLYSATHGDIAPILRRHAGQDIDEPRRARFAKLAIEAASEVLPAGSERALKAIGHYMEWGTHVAVDNSKPDHVPDVNAGVPSWDWESQG